MPPLISREFLRVFPRPKFSGDADRTQVARVWSDVNGILQTATLVFLAIYLAWSPTTTGTVVVSVFYAYLVVARVILMRGWLKVSIYSFSAACALLWQWVTWNSGNFQNMESLALCTGILLPVFVLGGSESIVVWVVYSVMLIGNHILISNGVVAGGVELRPTTQLIVGLVMLATIALIGQVVRNELIEQYQREAAMREKAQAELELRNQELSQYLQKAENRNDDLEKAVETTTRVLTEQAHIVRLNDLVAGVAHELSSPLGNAALMVSSMHNWAKELSGSEVKLSPRENVLALRIEEGCDIVNRNIKKIEEQIRQFKKLSKEANEQVPVTVDVSKAVSEALLMSKPILQSNDVKMLVHIESELEIHTMSGAIHQILTNLIANAVMHGLSGMPKKEISIEAVRSPDKKMVLVSVSDNGRGIPKDVLPHIFEPFFTTARDTGGMGLGLGIVHNLVTSVLEGHISVQSQPGLTRFDVKLPLRLRAHD